MPRARPAPKRKHTTTAENAGAADPALGRELVAVAAEFYLVEAAGREHLASGGQAPAPREINGDAPDLVAIAALAPDALDWATRMAPAAARLRRAVRLLEPGDPGRADLETRLFELLGRPSPTGTPQAPRGAVEDLLRAAGFGPEEIVDAIGGDVANVKRSGFKRSRAPSGPRTKPRARRAAVERATVDAAVTCARCEHHRRYHSKLGRCGCPDCRCARFSDGD